MDIRVTCSILCAYAFVYYILALVVLSRINRMDPDYFGNDDYAGFPTGVRTSVSIIEMVFDSDLPGNDYGRFVRIGLCVVRVMAALYIPLMVILLYATDWS